MRYACEEKRVSGQKVQIVSLALALPIAFYAAGVLKRIKIEWSVYIAMKEI